MAGSGKHLLRCGKCGARFTYDHGAITGCSHQDQAGWKVVIMDTLAGIPLAAISKKLDLNV